MRRTPGHMRINSGNVALAVLLLAGLPVHGADAASARASGAPALHPFCLASGKCGLIDKTGRFVVEPTLDAVYDRDGGVFHFIRGDKYGAMDALGKVIVPAEFDYITGRRDDPTVFAKRGRDWLVFDGQGLLIRSQPLDVRHLDPLRGGAAVFEGDGGRGLYDARSGYIVDPAYKSIYALADAAYLAYRKDGLIDLIDIERRQVVPTAFQGLYYEHGTLMGVRETGRKVIGEIIDRAGKVVVPAQDFIRVVDRGRAVVKKGRGYASIPIPDHDRFSGSPADLLWNEEEASPLVVVEQGGKLGYVDRDGKPVVKAQYDSASSHPEYGLYVVGRVTGRNKDGETIERKGALDSSGRIVIPLDYGKFSFLYVNDGLFDFEFKDRHGFMDRRGQVVVESRFESVSFFSDGFAPAMDNGAWGIIDAGGKVRVPFEYMQTEVHGELFRVRKGKEHGDPAWYLDRQGKVVARQARVCSKDVVVNHGGEILWPEGFIAECGDARPAFRDAR